VIKNLICRPIPLGSDHRFRRQSNNQQSNQQVVVVQQVAQQQQQQNLLTPQGWMSKI
jgi:hypothetical protein